MRPLKTLSKIALLFLALILWLPLAQSHLLKNSSSEIFTNFPEVEWILKIHLTDFNQVFEKADEEWLKTYVENRLKVSRGLIPCKLKQLDFEKNNTQELVTLKTIFTCKGDASTINVSYGLFFGDPGHRHLLKFTQGGRTLSHTFSPENTEASFSTRAHWQMIKNFLRLGFEHILLGYDHILFILSLLLGARRFKNLFWLITSFALAHSISLALATFDLIELSPKIVEPTIAASIVWVALWNYLSSKKEHQKGELGITFLFGLIHGLGFFTVLREANLSGTSLILPLISFNGGVELGQLLIIGILYPLTFSLKKKFINSYPFIQRAALILIALVGLYWMVTRTFFTPG